jgi:hypothetical protein
MKIRDADTFEEEATKFLNVDLDIFSKARLEPLVTAFGDKVWVHYVGPEGSHYGAHLELDFPKNPDAGIKALAALVRHLPMRALKLWKNAQSKDFNIGIQGGMKPHYCEFPLHTDTLSEIVKLGARVVITVYAAQPKSIGSQQRERDARVRISQRRASAMKKKSDKRRMG